jgi:protein-disulfide isomerase
MGTEIELVVAVHASDHVLGHAHAPVTLVGYGDFECPGCKQAAPSVRMLLARFPRKLRVVFRHFPLESVHPHALAAALAAEAAGSQGTFWAMHDILYENQAHLEDSQLRHYATRLQLDLARYDAEMADKMHLQRVRQDVEGGARSGVRATPTFFVNGVLHDVSYGLERLHRKVEDAVRAS